MLVTFKTWAHDYTKPDDPRASKPVTVDPNQVSDVEDYCGSIKPGSLITLKSGKTYLVAGEHSKIVQALENGRSK